MKVETGRLISPFGTDFVGVRITVGGIADPDVVRRYDDIERILKGHRLPFRVHEEHKENGTFRSYSVET